MHSQYIVIIVYVLSHNTETIYQGLRELSQKITFQVVGATATAGIPHGA